MHKLTPYLPKSILVLKEGYTFSNFLSDLFAGTSVAIVALPLAMAFAIASGVSPEKGLFTAIVAGFLISALGGSRYQIGGPTGAFVVVLYATILKHGYDGLVIATIIAGILLILMGVFKLGSVIKFIPYPVTVGFTAGIALIIFSSQVKDFLGLPLEKVPAEFIDQWKLYLPNLVHLNPYALLIAIAGIGIILYFKRFFPRIPGPIVVVIAGALATWLLGLPVETIESKFGAIPSMLPSPSLPDFSLEKIRAVFPDALTIALLGAIESLLSAVVADGMTGRRHHSNKELVAQGIANIASVSFGGIAATGAIARTATNIKSGAFSPLAGMIHAVMLLVFMLLFSHWIVKIPLAALASILVVVAWNMSEFHHFKAILLHSVRADALVLVTTFLLTVLVDLNTGVQTGIMLAGVLFIKRMVEVTQIKDIKGVFGLELEEEEEEIDDPDAISKKVIPPHTEVYEINGPFFFGVADTLKSTLDFLESPPKVFILRMRKVPMVDTSGLHALEEFYEMCHKKGTVLVLSGVSKPLQKKIEKYGLASKIGPENITDHIDTALQRARQILALEAEQQA